MTAFEFARSLPSPKFYEAIKDAEPVSPIYAHRAPTGCAITKKVMLPGAL